MKKLTAIIVFVLLVASGAFAKRSADEVTEKVRSAFQKSFNYATDVNWKKQNTNYVASFRVSGQDVSAMYNEEGDFVSATRHQSLSQLPLVVQVALHDKYPGYKVSDDVFEFYYKTTDDTGYYIALENDKQQLRLRSDASGNLTVEDRMRIK